MLSSHRTSEKASLRDGRGLRPRIRLLTSSKESVRPIKNLYNRFCSVIFLKLRASASILVRSLCSTLEVDILPLAADEHVHGLPPLELVSLAAVLPLVTEEPVVSSAAMFPNTSLGVWNGAEAEQKGKNSFVATLRILFSVLGVFMLLTLVYTLITDGSPFRMDLLTPSLHHLTLVAIGLMSELNGTEVVGLLWLFIANSIPSRQARTCHDLVSVIYLSSTSHELQNVCRWLTATLVDFYINVVALAVGAVKAQTFMN
ncbi:putative transmembrane protein [Senna tora]|uniref:Putative transmembrane protein n=1 Tax=Senna tora TaxID=362788 RepID=A0A834SZX4_9FABA|nr:putative transmembrane protein [Senna tora]